MTVTMKDRQKALEERFAKKADQLFNLLARRNRAAAIWAGQALGKSGEALEDYARAYAGLVVTCKGAELEVALHDKLVADLNGVVSAAEIEAKLHEIMDTLENEIGQ